MATQVIEMMDHIFQVEGLDIFIKPYQIISTGSMSGLVEFIMDAQSIDRIKKACPDVPTLKEYFDYAYGPAYSVQHINAVQHFVKSLVGYSLLTYLLQVRDRHNANLLLDPSVSPSTHQHHHYMTIINNIIPRIPVLTEPPGIVTTHRLTHSLGTYHTY